MKKRGISAIVATVLIILITVAAISIIWAVILPMISGNLEKGTVCLEAARSISINENAQFTCKTVDTAKYQIKRGSDSLDIAGLDVIIEDSNGNSVTKSISKANVPGQNQVKAFTSNVGNPAKVSVAAKVQTENGVQVCDASKPVVLPTCAGGINPPGP